jgi:spermidine synthase
MPILLLFFCSGATALVYEVIWSKYLSLLFGSTIQAQTVVLAVFMGGLALGNKLFGKRADRAQKPLVIYGGIEIGIGLYAFLFPSIYRLTDAIFASAGSRLLDHTGWLLLLKGILSAGLLLGPTILMGGTLPVLAAWLQRNTADAGRRSARFYSTNSLGAVCGAGLAGFFLVQRFGMPMTMKMTAVVNVLVGLIAIGIGRSRTARLSAAEQNAKTSNPMPDPPEAASTIFGWGCVLVALTGAVSMGLEVLASRCLCLIFGASLQVFAIVLMAFILGIGVGSAVIASPRRRYWSREVTTVLLLLGAATLIGLLVFNIENLATVYLYAQYGLSRTVVGYSYHQIFTSVVAIFVLGLPAAALGSVLPVWIRGSEAAHLLGDRVGRLVTWNTLGAVGGVLLTGFVLLPKIGLRGSFTTMALVLAVVAILMALTTRQRVVAVAGVAIGLLLLLVSVRGGEEWRYVFSAGVFRLPDTGAPVALLQERIKRVQLLFYEDAADATVSVEGEQSGSHSQIALLINGKTEATSMADRSTQLLVAQLPLMVKPDSKDVFCFGMGSGITAASALGYPIEHLTIAENCAPVLRAAKLFEPWNHGVYTNDRVRIYHEDARTVLKLSAQKYDVIISEPSNPWMVGIGSVFTREFYQLAANRLKPGGIMAQWFHTYEMDDRNLDVVLRTFGSVFPSMEIWDVDDGDICLMGSSQPWESNPEVYQRAFKLEGPRSDLASIGLLTPEAVLARQSASQYTAFAIAGAGPLQSDDFPILEYDAPRAFYMYHGSWGVQRLHLYDERTWQVGIAPPAKNKVLAQLDTADLLPIFGKDFGSANQNLQSYLENRFQGHVGSLTFGNRIMPCIFEGTNGTLLVYAPPSAATNMTARQLYYAEATLRTDPTRQLQAIGAIKDILDSLKNYKPQDTDWSAAYYAALAVRASERLGDPASAKAILLRGLQLEPDSDELNYLSRILIHEGILLPSEIAGSHDTTKQP